MVRGESRLVDVSEDLPTNVLAPGLLVVEDTGRGGEDDLSEGPGREQQVDPVLDVTNGDVVTGGDDTSLVETTVELNDDLAGAMIVDDLELADVSVALHDTEELDDDLGGRTDENLALATALSVDNVVEAVVKDGYADHFW